MPERADRVIRPIATNRKALHDYFVMQNIEAGIQLTGTEVKSLRAGKVNFKDAYATFPTRNSDEIVLINLHISAYEFGNRENHQPLRARKLLLNKREAQRLRSASQEQGLSIVPLGLYFSGPYVKVELGIVKGKKSYDKRAAVAEREADRAMRRMDDE